MLDFVTDIIPPPDYFTITPPTSQYHDDSHHHISTEKPLISPTSAFPDLSPHPEHPLPAYQDAIPPSVHLSASLRRTSSLMSVQTSAAHGHMGNRPRPHPMQNMLHVTSDDSGSSDSSSSSYDNSSFSTATIARCSRCQRTQSLDIHTGKSNMIQYGLNLWYCSRCAALVGLVKR